MNFMQHLWYKQHASWQQYLLQPLACIYGLVTWIRRWFYRLFKPTAYPIPIIVVGNLTVGGTGKTPVVIALAEYLQQHGLRPGIVTRGYGGCYRDAVLHVTADTPVAVCGDETKLLAMRTGCSVYAARKRHLAVAAILAHENCDVVLSDDGLQHYALPRDIEIILLDGQRGLGNRCLLPAGPLRESAARLKTTEFVLTHGIVTDPHQFSLQGEEFVSLHDSTLRRDISSFRQQAVHAVAGLGNPERFFQRLEQAGLQIQRHIFPDHYLYQEQDFSFSDLPILMTEKDAQKCFDFSLKNAWYLPVEAELPQEFLNKILKKTLEIRRKKLP